MSERFTSRVAIFVLLIQDHKIFLMRRANAHYMDGWYGLPSGHLEENEFLVEGAQRELREEAGVEVDPADLEFAHVMYRRKDRNYIDFYFVAKQWQGEPHIAEPEKCDDAQWFDFDAMPENTFDYIKDVVKDLGNKNFFSERMSQY